MTNRKFGQMLPGTFERTRTGWTALLDVGPNNTDEELAAHAHRMADRLSMRRDQIRLVDAPEQVAGLARLHIKLSDLED